MVGEGKGLAFYNQDAEMAGAAVLASRHVLERSGAGARARGRVRDGGRMGEIMMDGRLLRRARVAKQSLAVSSPLLSRVPVILDYTPYVGHMIPADDGWRRPRLRQTRGAAARTDVVAGRIREKFECVCRCPGCAE